jgi:hypothetical protein
MRGNKFLARIPYLTGRPKRKQQYQADNAGNDDSADTAYAEEKRDPLYMHTMTPYLYEKVYYYLARQYISKPNLLNV